MEYLTYLINAYLPYAPFLIGAFLMLGGLGLPISEDLLVIFGGVLAAKYPDMAIYIYLGIFFGAYFGDAITYWLGRLVGIKLLETRLWKNAVSKEQLNRFASYFAKNAYLVIYFGRFIPFGIRVLIYLTAGFSKFDYKKFALIDFFAVLSTTSLTFVLSYIYGENIINFLDNAKYIIFGIFILFVLFLAIRKIIKNRQKNKLNSN